MTMSLPTSPATFPRYAVSTVRRVGRIPLLVVAIWVLTLWWGERSVFRQSAAACQWHLWESWPTAAHPHHVLFVADPQLVDPHTYPGRPWPLSTLTVLYTDLYMRRTYGYLLHHLQPHTTMFLGDLFDGGREWAAADYESPEDRYKSYRTNFWIREYNRFMKMFVGGWYNNEWDGYLTGEGRRIIASLPGNHDLGFAGGINEHVRDRFEAHFGPSNRVDVLGNHTFVSLDTVSLSAMDQVDPSTGGSGAGDGTGHDTKHMEIWKPVEGFLMDVKSRRAKAVQRRYQHLESLMHPQSKVDDSILHKPTVRSIDRHLDPKATGSKRGAAVSSSNFPTILLSHVPLYRNQEVTCGPLRERGVAIPLSAGYQYQNVLTEVVSKDIVDHLDAEQITMIYSGDDHDYCEIEHGEFTGQIKEITVKSMSWAMGVRKPGVQLASLWNPIDLEAIARGETTDSTPRDTVQNRLCLLPDQLAIFIRYGQLLGLTIIILFIRAIVYNPVQAHQNLSSSPTEKTTSQPLLPLSRKHTPPGSPQQQSAQTSRPSHTARARARSTGKMNTYGNVPSSSRSTSTSPVTPDFSQDISDRSSYKGQDHHPYARSQPSSYPFPSTSHPQSPPRRHSNRTRLEKMGYNLATPASTKYGEFTRSLILVAGPVLIFYFWLLWNG